MSTIKSSAEHLTLNADGASKDIKFQANGVEKASISSAGAFTSTTIDATALTGTIPNFTSTGIDDNADATAMTIDSSENVGIGTASPEDTLEVQGTLKVKASLDHTEATYLKFGRQDQGDGNYEHHIKATHGSGTTQNKITFALCNQNATGHANVLTLDGVAGTSTLSGNLVIGTAGKGIDFSAYATSGNPSSNLLDDYEEGTWTASLQGSGGSVGHTTQTCWYIKVGKVCHIGGTIQWSSAGSNANTYTKIAGMPFTAASSGVNGRACGTVGAIGGFTNSEDLSLVNDAGTSSMWVIKRTGTTYTHNNSIDASGNFYGFTLSYPCV